MSEDKSKFKEALIYLIRESGDGERFGEVEIGKMLYYSDCAAYRQLTGTITGIEYYRRGNAAAPRRLSVTLDELVAEGAISVQGERGFSSASRRASALRDADMSVFSDAEITIMSDVVAYFLSMSDIEILRLADNDIGWKVVDQGQTIPLRTSYLSARPLTAEQRGLGREVAFRQGLSIPR